MGLFGSDDAADAARAARIDEMNRQARIRAGTAAINNTFDGGQVGVGALLSGAKFDPTKTYYTADGNVWRPPEGSRSRDPFGTALQQGLFSGVETRAGFGDSFFSGIRDSFTNFARPQLDDQFRKAGEQSTFNMARSGILDSSMRGEQNADLQERYDVNLQDITDQARGFETEARNNVERARGDLVAMLQATGDATGAANSALTRASTLATPPSYSPLGQLFQDTSALVGQQLAQERAFALGLAPRPRNSVRTPGASGSSVEVT